MVKKGGKMRRIIILVVIGLMGGLYAQDIVNKPNEDYRIEVVNEEDSTCATKEIRFVSPDGDIVKVMPVKKVEYLKSPQKGKEIVKWYKVLVSKNCKYVLSIESSRLVYASNRQGVDHNFTLRFSYLNAKGSVLWGKQFTVWSKGLGWEPYGYRVSNNGAAILFFSTKELEYNDFETQIYVFDILGNEVANLTYNTKIDDSQISPDGKLVGAKVFKDKEGKRGTYLFFLDVDTGRTKIVKAKGEGWGVSIILSKGGPLVPGKILFILRKGSIPSEYTYENVYLSFDEIPDNLSVLFGKGAEK